MDFNPGLTLIPLIILIFTGMPLAFVLGLVGMIFGYLEFGSGFFNIIPSRFFDSQTNYLYICLPLFIFMGNMLDISGAAEKLYSSMYIILGKIRGGLAYTTVIICAIFAAATGVIGASVTTMGLIALPGMLKRNYNMELATGTVMAAGCLGVVIPPSTVLVLYGSWANLSVGRLYMACVFPGLMLAGIYMLYIFIKCNVLDKTAGPAMSKAEIDAVPTKAKWRGVLVSVVPVIVLIILVLGSILLGICTPTEASALGAVGSLFMAIGYRTLTWKSFLESTFRTARVSAMIMLIASGALIYTSAFLGSGGASQVQNFIIGLGLGKWGFIIVVNILLFVMGMFLDWFAILVICVPIFAPLYAKFGFDPYWFAAMSVVNLQAAYLTPPFGFALFYIKGIAPRVSPNLTMDVIIKAVRPYLLLVVCGVIILCLFPQIATWLPDAFYQGA